MRSAIAFATVLLALAACDARASLDIALDTGATTESAVRVEYGDSVVVADKLHLLVAASTEGLGGERDTLLSWIGSEQFRSLLQRETLHRLCWDYVVPGRYRAMARAEVRFVYRAGTVESYVFAPHLVDVVRDYVPPEAREVDWFCSNATPIPGFVPYDRPIASGAVRYELGEFLRKAGISAQLSVRTTEWMLDS